MMGLCQQRSVAAAHLRDAKKTPYAVTSRCLQQVFSRQDSPLEIE